MKNIVFIFLIIPFVSLAQAKESIYFLLKKGDYTETKTESTITLKTKRLVTSISFGIPCTNCNYIGLLGFYFHNNPDTGETLEGPVAVGTKKMKSLKFTSLPDLIKVMKKNDAGFNGLFNLYFVEPGEKNTMYQVKRLFTFADDEPDLVDTTRHF
jgi:hypothetical protein